MISALEVVGSMFILACTVAMLMLSRVLYYIAQDGQVSDEHTGTHAEQVSDEQEDFYDEQDLGQSEKDMLFDMRIARMKDELAAKQDIEPKRGYPAEEGPGVSNLPHSLIPDLHTNMISEEYAK